MPLEIGAFCAPRIIGRSRRIAKAADIVVRNFVVIFSYFALWRANRELRIANCEPRKNGAE
jgi:hypothetical protein